MSETDDCIGLLLYSEAKEAAVSLAKTYNVTEADVVARALGILWLLTRESHNGNRAFVEDRNGGRRLISVFIKAGDAGSSAAPPTGPVDLSSASNADAAQENLPDLPVAQPCGHRGSPDA